MAQTAPINRGAFHDPKTKEDLLDRMMRRDFTGDLADLAEDRNLRMERVRPHIIRLHFGASGKTYDLTVHKPRPEGGVKSTRAEVETDVEDEAPRAPPRKAKRSGRRSEVRAH